MKWVAMLGVVACAFATGCDSDNGAGGRTLAGTKWRLTAWSANLVNPARYSISADFDASDISGRSAVNLYGGSYTATDKGKFSIGDIAVTAMAGPPDAMRAESLYFDLLGQAREYELSETTLTLKNEGGQKLLIFVSSDP